MRRTHSLIFALILLLIRAPVAAAYPDLHLGIGSVNNCQASTGSAGDNAPSCYRGWRGDVLVDLVGINRTGKIESGDGGESNGSSSVFGRGSRFNSGVWFPTSRGEDVFAVMLLIVLVVVAAYGIIWGIASLFAADVSLGIYGAVDTFPTSDAVDGTTRSGSLTRWGLQTGLFPSKRVPVRVHIGAGPASWQTSEDDDGTYRDGFSTKGGIGFVPRPGHSGPFIFGEAEYLTLYSRTLNDVIRNNSPRRVPEYRLTTAVLAGYKAAW